MVLVPKAEEEEGNLGMARGRNKGIREGRLQCVTRAILIRVMIQESKRGKGGGGQRHIREAASWQKAPILESVLLQSIPHHARKEIAPRLPWDPGLQHCQHTKPRADTHTVAVFPSHLLSSQSAQRPVVS